MAQPLFVIGRNRSGTKWLSNVLSNAEGVTSLRRDDETGIVETDVFDKFPAAFGELRIKENRLAFLACFLETNSARLSGLAREEIAAIPARDYPGFFRAFMDLTAERRGCRAWLQKGSSLLLPTLHAAYPDARFVVIRRDLRDNVRSSLAQTRLFSGTPGRPRDTRSAPLVNEVLSYHLHRKVEERYLDEPNVALVRYEELLADPEATARRACEALGLPFEPALLEVRARRNTSYRGQLRRDEVLTPAMERTLRWLDPLAAATPLPALRAAHRLRALLARGAVNPQRFTMGTFNLFRDELEPDREGSRPAAGEAGGEPRARPAGPPGSPLEGTLEGTR